MTAMNCPYSREELEENPCRLAKGIIEIELPSIEFDEGYGSEEVKEQKRVFTKLINDAQSFDITSDLNTGNLVVTMEISDVYVNTIELKLENGEMEEPRKETQNDTEIKADSELQEGSNEDDNDEDNGDDDNEMMHDDDPEESGSNYDTFYDKFG